MSLKEQIKILNAIWFSRFWKITQFMVGFILRWALCKIKIYKTNALQVYEFNAIKWMEDDTEKDPLYRNILEFHRNDGLLLEIAWKVYIGYYK
jgi:hypothetical protein